MKRTLLFLVVSTSLLACQKDDKGDKGEKPQTSAKPDDAPAPKKPAGPFDSWDLEARRAAFQGAHVAWGDADWEAWQIDGDKLVSWDGKAERKFAFEVISPCEAQRTETQRDGSTMGTVSHFTLKDGKIVTVLGDAGSRRGAEAIACVSNKVVTLDATGTCLEWDEDFRGGWESSPGTCGWKDAATFTAKVNGMDVELKAEGDALFGASASKRSEPMADFEAAKQGIVGRPYN